MDRGGAYADILLDRAARSKDLSDPRDRALLTEIVMGTLRRRGTLDYAISPHASRPLEKIDPFARNALRVGAYQILFTRVPERAALHETVEAVRKRRGAGPAGFVNAVLRALLREGREVRLPPEPGRARDAVRLSAPPELIDALAASLGEEEAAALLADALAVPPFAVRANALRTTREALAARLAAAGMDPSPCRFSPDGLVLGRPAGVHADPGFLTGEYLVMDEGAQLIAPLLSPREGEAVLDACAAPGGKATHLAALSRGKARITATDSQPARLAVLKETVRRTGSPGVEVAAHDFSRGPLPGREGAFDKVLVDAPCTGMGVVRRNPDAKWRFRPEWPADMARLQGAILAHAWACLRPGGLLVYCTCSPLREENEEVAARLARDAAGRAVPERVPGWPGPEDAWTPEGFLRLGPARHGTDAFFAAVLRKTG